LNTIHNLFYYITLLIRIKEAIREGHLLDFYQSHTAQHG
jgi:tRNA-guanine family transglycosylase